MTNEQQRVNIVRMHTAQYMQNLRMALHGAGVASKDILEALDRATTDGIMAQICGRFGMNPAASNNHNHPWQRNRRFAKKRGSTNGI